MEIDVYDDKALAAAALAGWRGAQEMEEPHDPMQIADWLEGHLDEAGASEVERMLASNPTLLDAFLAGRTSKRLEATVQEIEAARALVKMSWRQQCRQALNVRTLRWGVALSVALISIQLGTSAFAIGKAFATSSEAQRSAAMRLVLDDGLPSALEEK